MNGNVYRCLDCYKVLGTTFESDGLRCPYCDGLIVPIGKVFSKDQFKKIRNENKQINK